MAVLLGAGVASAAESIQGTLGSDTTWTAARGPYTLTGDVIVPAGVTLTVEPGVVVNAARSDALKGGENTIYVELIVRGTLRVKGTPAQPVTFQADRATSSPWGGIRVEAGTTSTLSGVLIRDASTGLDVTGASTSAGGPSSAAALLDDASMLAPAGARPTDPKRTWTVGSTVRGPIPAGSGPACLGSDPLEGAPTAQQTITRTLTSSGSAAPTALHVAQAYGSAEDATQAFAVTSRALGTCAVTGDWLSTGAPRAS